MANSRTIEQYGSRIIAALEGKPGYRHLSHPHNTHGHAYPVNGHELPGQAILT
jgi:hypothetical protein